MLAQEAGVHRIQRIPGNDKRGRVHSSTATVAVMGQAQASGPWALREERHFKLEWFSGQGAGGQHRNKHQNSARLIHLPTGLVRCSQTRSRANSLEEAKHAMMEALDAMAEQARGAATNEQRCGQIGRGERADRQRIWRFQHDRVDDLRSGKQMRCAHAMRGAMDGLWEQPLPTPGRQANAGR